MMINYMYVKIFQKFAILILFLLMIGCQKDTESQEKNKEQLKTNKTEKISEEDTEKHVPNDFILSLLVSDKEVKQHPEFKSTNSDFKSSKLIYLSEEDTGLLVDEIKKNFEDKLWKVFEKDKDGLNSINEEMQWLKKLTIDVVLKGVEGEYFILVSRQTTKMSGQCYRFIVKRVNKKWVVARVGGVIHIN